MKSLKKFAQGVCVITVGVVNNFVYFIKFNLRYFAGLANVLLPYVMYVLGQSRYAEATRYSCGLELLVPIAVTVIVYYIREFANRSNLGNSLPVPTKRFTQVDEFGEVTIENRRVQELLLYTADLEDWLHRKGLL